MCIRDRVREAPAEVQVKIADRLEHTHSARLIREVPGAHEELPSKALSIAGGGQQGTDPRDPKGLKSLHRLFQFDLELPPEVGPLPVSYTHLDVYKRQSGRIA